MAYYYAAPQSKTHAFFLERSLKAAGIPCELTYMPRPVSTGVCNMGVKFAETYCNSAIGVIKASGIPGCRVFLERMDANNSYYQEVTF
jgi:hypothetical protein